MEADVIGIPGLHIECKRHAKVHYRSALRQAVEDASDGDVPIVIAKDDAQPAVVHLQLSDFIEHFLKPYVLGHTPPESKDTTGAVGLLRQALALLTSVLP